MFKATFAASQPHAHMSLLTRNNGCLQFNQMFSMSQPKVLEEWLMDKIWYFEKLTYLERVSGHRVIILQESTTGFVLFFIEDIMFLNYFNMPLRDKVALRKARHGRNDTKHKDLHWQWRWSCSCGPVQAPTWQYPSLAPIPITRRPAYPVCVGGGCRLEKPFYMIYLLAVN